jgi:hypothetical protein
LLDATIVAIGAGVLSWVMLVTPYVSDSSLSLLTRIGAIVYPAGDLLVLTLLLRLLAAGESPADLVARADVALYRAKEAGRNRAVAAGEPSEAATAVS